MSDVHPDNEGMVDEEVGVEEAKPNTTEAPTESKTMEIAGHTFDETQLPLFVVLLSSVVLLIATGAHYDWGNYSKYGGYAISVSSISLSLSCLAILMVKFSEDLYNKVGKQMNLLNFVWSFVGACFLTFDKPFTETGNGYFAAWTCVFACAMSCGMDAKSFGSNVKGLGSVMGLLASSLVVIVASIAPIREDCFDPANCTQDPNRSEAVYALALSCVTFFLLGLVMLMDKKDKRMPANLYFATLAILSMCWIIMACLVTFRGPFDVTGNGYFGSWVGALTCSMTAFAAKKAL